MAHSDKRHSESKKGFCSGPAARHLCTHFAISFVRPARGHTTWEHWMRNTCLVERGSMASPPSLVREMCMGHAPHGMQVGALCSVRLPWLCSMCCVCVRCCGSTVLGLFGVMACRCRCQRDGGMGRFALCGFGLRWSLQSQPCFPPHAPPPPPPNALSHVHLVQGACLDIPS